jgi:hypothetical protein
VFATLQGQEPTVSSLTKALSLVIAVDVLNVALIVYLFVFRLHAFTQWGTVITVFSGLANTAVIVWHASKVRQYRKHPSIPDARFGI